MSLKVLVSVIVSLTLWSAPVLAQVDRAERLASVFFDWAEATGAAAPEIVILHEGATVLAEARDVAPGGPRVMASLTKSVTAQCVAGLVEEGRLRWDAPLSTLLGREGEAGAATLAALVTQSAGFAEDRTQAQMGVWLQGRGDWRDVAGWAQDVTEPGRHRYSNENYALLGSVIEAATGLPVEQACNGVLPGGSPAEAVPAFGPMGGWQAPLADFALYQAMLYGNRPPEGPVAEIGSGAVYGLGMFGRPLDGEWIWWHIGALCLEGQVEATSYALTLPGGWGLALATGSCPDFDRLGDLDRALWEAFGDD